MTRKFWRNLIILLLTIPVLLFGIALSVLVVKQEDIVQHFLRELNEDIEGYIVIGSSRIAPFQNFPYVSIDLKDVQVFESEKYLDQGAILQLEDIYVGFDMMKLIAGNIEIKSISLQNGFLKIEQNRNAELNISRAFQPKKPSDEVAEALNLKLKKVKIKNVDFSKFNEDNLIKIDAFVEKGTIGVEKNTDFSALQTDLNFVFTIIQNEDSTFFKNKNCSLKTDITFLDQELLLQFNRATLTIEQSEFDVSGTVQLRDDIPIDLQLEGSKTNFDLFISLAPEELSPVLKRYENAGNVFFTASLEGPTLNAQPAIEARFGCKETFIANQFNKKRIDELQFNAYFTNGDERSVESMFFELRDFEARPEAGRFKGNLSVRNFREPEIDMRIDSDFNLDFLTSFFEIDNIFKLSGQVLLQMNFRDIIDLNNPEKSLNKLDQAYHANLKVNNLSFESPDFHLPIRKIDVEAETSGENFVIHKIDAKIGNSDLLISGSLSNIIDLVHHTDQQVVLEIFLKSELLDLEDLTKSKRNPEQFIDDKIKNFNTHFTFSGSAKDLTEFNYLPQGRFILDDLNATFQNYPHRLHDFDVDITIDDEDIRVHKFHGEIDDSDIDLYASMSNFVMFLKDDTSGTTQIKYRLESNKLILKDLLTYNGENFLPDDYRDEVFEKMVLNGTVQLSFFQNELKSTEINLDKLQGKMRLHPLKFERFSGKVKLENEQLVIQSLKGKLGNSEFSTYLKYYLGKEPKRKKYDNYLKFSAPRLDIDQLTNFNPPQKGEKVDHDAGFNIYELPFSDMKFELNIGELNYHNQRLQNVKTVLRTTTNHFIYLDKLNLDVAGGNINGRAYFDGSDPKQIYLNPDLKIEKIDLSKLLLKFDNFGQDELVADNLTGRFSGAITGKIRLYTDMVPKINESEVNLDFAVYNGVLINFAPMLALGDFFQDRNLRRVSFDTLQNKIHVNKGYLTIPQMTVNTSLGFLILEGTQDQSMQMNYLVRVPLRMVTQVASQKLFRRKKEEIDPEREDDIISHDKTRRTAFINVRVTGTPDAYKVNLERNRKRNTRVD